MAFKVTQSLQDTVEQNDHIEEVHFTADGKHHFRVFDHGGKKYTRLQEIPEKLKSGVLTSKLVLAPIKNRRNEDHEDHLIVETVSRDEILKAKPVADPQESAIKKADLLATLEISEEELAAFLKARKK